MSWTRRWKTWWGNKSSCSRSSIIINKKGNRRHDVQQSNVLQQLLASDTGREQSVAGRKEQPQEQQLEREVQQPAQQMDQEIITTARVLATEPERKERKKPIKETKGIQVYCLQVRWNAHGYTYGWWQRLWNWLYGCVWKWCQSKEVDDKGYVITGEW